MSIGSDPIVLCEEAAIGRVIAPVECTAIAVSNTGEQPVEMEMVSVGVTP